MLDQEDTQEKEVLLPKEPASKRPTLAEESTTYKLFSKPVISLSISELVVGILGIIFIAVGLSLMIKTGAIEQKCDILVSTIYFLCMNHFMFNMYQPVTSLQMNNVFETVKL